jgi:hypothetical protein
MSAQNKKVVILDSIQANKIINQLVKGDVARAQIKIYKQMDSVSQLRIKTLKIGNDNLLKAFNEKQLEAENYQKALKRQKRKSTFYKVTTIVGVLTTGILLLK